MALPIDQGFNMLISLMGGGDIPLTPISEVLSKANGDPTQLVVEFVKYVLNNPGLFMIIKRFVFLIVTGSASAIQVVGSSIFVYGAMVSIVAVKLMCVIFVLLLGAVGVRHFTDTNIAIFLHRIKNAPAQEVAIHLGNIIEKMHDMFMRGAQNVKNHALVEKIRQKMKIEVMGDGLAFAVGHQRKKRTRRVYSARKKKK
jgi:hypothetical protein